MSNMFSDTTSFNSNISNWDVSNVTNMSYMFRNATAFNTDIDTWFSGKEGNVSGIYTCSSEKECNVVETRNILNPDISGWTIKEEAKVK